MSFRHFLASRCHRRRPLGRALLLGIALGSALGVALHSATLGCALGAAMAIAFGATGVKDRTLPPA